MSYSPPPILTTGVGEARAWVIDSDAGQTLEQIRETLERIQQQLALVTGAELRPGDKLE